MNVTTPGHDSIDGPPDARGRIDAAERETEETLPDNEFELCPRGRVLADLPCFDYWVEPATRLGVVVDELQRRPDLPGVILRKGTEVAGVLPRSAVFEHLSRPFGHELFLPRPAAGLLDDVAFRVLRLSGLCPIHQAAWHALRRPTDRVFDPILLDRDVDRPRLLDVHTLLLAQSRLLSEANQTIQRQRDWEKAANEAKSQFLANMSHEIRTPLTAILGFAETMLEQGADLADILRSARIILRNGDHLLQVINDVLDLSKIEAGRLEVERLPMEVLPVIGDAVNLIKVKTQAKGLDLRVEFGGRIPRRITSDPTRLRQILLNLLGNAVKFTEAGSVVLRISAVHGEASAERLRLDVIDTGIGLTPAQVSRLFQPFSQADVSMARRFGGTGLGLSISRQLARMLGGDVRARGREEGGSEFTLTISTGPIPPEEMLDDPQHAFSTWMQDGGRPAPESYALSGAILLADDGPDNQLLISSVLRKWGADVTVCDNGQQAVELALDAARRGAPFDCILMDMQMPLLDGYEATRALRNAGYVHPIIALTANAMGSDRERCLSAGCSDYATKPINRRELAAQIRRFTPGQAGADDSGIPDDASIRPDADPPGRAESPSSFACFSPRQLMERVGGDSNLAAEMVSLFLTQVGHWAPQLKEELTSADRRTLRRNAHSLKSAADTTGGCSLAEAARRLEDAAAHDAPIGTLRELGTVVSHEIQRFRGELERFQAAAADDMPSHRMQEVS